jgi:hypothetical protein
MSDLQASDRGTKIRVTVKEGSEAFDISSASIKKIIFQKKNKEILEVDADFLTDGKDGKLQYVTSGSDVSMSGDWKLQAYLELSGSPGGAWHTSIAEMSIAANLK